MQKLLLLIYILSNTIILQSSDEEPISEKNSNYKKNQENIACQCKEIIENLKKAPEIMLIQEQESSKKHHNGYPSIMGGGKDIYLYERAVFTSLADEAKTIIKQITSENIQDYEFNCTILTHLQAIQSCLEFNSKAPYVVNYAYRGLDQIAYVYNKKINIMIELIQLKSQLKFQRLYQNATNDIKNFIHHTLRYLDDKEYKLSNHIEESYSKKLDEIKNYIGIKESDGISIKDYIENKTEIINTFINQKEKNLEQILKKSIFSLSRISFCIILGIFSHSAYQRLININNNKQKNKKTYKSFLIFLIKI